MSAIAEAAASRLFHLGLAVGALAMVAVLFVPWLRRRPVAVVSGAMAGALALSMLDARLAVTGLLCLTAAVALPVRARTPRIALLVVGTLGLALSAPSAAAGLFLAAAIAVASSTVTAVISARGAALTAALLAVSVAGIWVAVPDTEEILLTGGVLVLPLLIAMGGGLARLDTRWWLAVSAAIVGPVAWAAVVGGRARPGSMVSGIATLGLLLVEPMARRIACAPASSPIPVPLVVVLLGVQAAVVAGTARIAASFEAVGPAALVSVVALAAGTAAVSLVLVAQRPR